MDHHVTLRLRPGRHALPRLVATLHALGLDVRELSLRDGVVRFRSVGGAPVERVRAVLERLLDVVDVVGVVGVPEPRTRVVVTRQPWQGETTPHPWARRAC